MRWFEGTLRANRWTRHCSVRTAGRTLRHPRRSCGRRYSRFLRSPTGRLLVCAPLTPARTTEARSDPLSCAERIPKLHIHRSPSNPLCACSLLVLTGPRCGENVLSPECPRGSSSALCTPTTLRSAASCTHSDPSHAHRPRIVGACERQPGTRTRLVMSR